MFYIHKGMSPCQSKNIRTDIMEKEKKSYFINVIEAQDGKMHEVFNFNFGGHHDLAKLVDKTEKAGLVGKEKHAMELVLGVRLLHHVLKKYPDSELMSSFAPQLKAFKDAIKETIKSKIGGCSCNCNQ